MKKIKVSIIITAYNFEKYIKRCIESATNQSLKEIEIIVVNDGSTDGTWKIIEKLSLEDDRLVIINKENGGESSSINAASDVAKGEYIQELDGDDWMEVDACKQTYQYAIENDLDIVVCDYYRDNGNGKIRYVNDLNCGKSFYSNEEYLSCFLQKKSATLSWPKLVKTDLYKSVKRPIDNFMSADLITVFKWALKAKKIGKLKKSFIHWMANPDSVTRKEPAKLMYQTFEVYDEIESLLKKNKKFEQYKEDLLSMRHFSFVAFFTQKPFYNNDNYQRGLNYMLTYLKQNDNPKKVNSSRHVLVRALKKYPHKIVFYALNLVFYLSPF
jgi:glycosyltransferase involved in cell wall biosynthesis